MADLRGAPACHDLPGDAAYVNPRAGAVALGHPLTMSGAVLLLTAARRLHTRGAKALCTLCVGLGQGAALALERI